MAPSGSSLDLLELNPVNPFPRSNTTMTTTKEFDPLNFMFGDESGSGSNSNAGSVFGDSAANNSTSSLEQYCIGHAANVELYTFIIVGILTGLICILGLIGNLLSTIVLIKTQLSVSVNLLLLALTFFDTIVILYSALAFSLPPLFGYLDTGFWYTRHIFPLIAPFILPLGYFGRTGSFYFTVAVTVERYIVVCWPLHARVWCTHRRAIYFTILVFIFTILYTLPKWFEIESFEIHESNAVTNQTTWICYALRPTPLSYDSLYNLLYNLLYLFIMAIFPFSILVILNFAIYKEIKSSNMTRGTITSTQLSENSIAVMLLFVVLVFFVCALPATTLHLLDMFEIIDYHRLAIDMSGFLVTLNSCVNFGIYYVCGQRFRNNFMFIWNQYCSCCPMKVNLRTTYSTTNMNTNTHVAKSGGGGGGKTECEMI